MKLVGLVLSALLLSQNQVFADTPQLKYCVDHTSRYILQNFAITEGQLGKITFIDTFERQNVELFCGLNGNGSDPNEVTNSERIEISCVSSHFPSQSPDSTIRFRIHRKLRQDLPKLGLLEIQPKESYVGSIDEIIPLVCE